MLKNVASQYINALILDTAGAIVTTGTTTVYITGDTTAQASGGTATHEGQGVWQFAPSQANTNYDSISFAFSNSVGTSVPTHLQVYTVDNSLLATAAAQTTIEGKIDTVDTNVDSILADTGTDGVVISTATAQAIADEALKRDWTSVTGEAARSTLNALRFLRNKWSISGSALTVTQENDTTTAWTATLTTDAAADPVTGNDPA